MARSCFVVFAVGILFCFATGAHAEEVVDARHLHALLIVDTNDPHIGESVKTDLNRMSLLLEWGIPEQRRSIAVLEGDDVTPEKIKALIAKIDVQPTDTLVVYYAGHGAWYAGGHYLRMNGGKILERKHLLEAMRAKKPRLTILISDCCSTYVGQQAFAQKLENDPDTFRDLFFRHKGLVDLTAASKGQVAVGDKIQGGYFTSSLGGAISIEPRRVLDTNQDGIVSWGEVWSRVKISCEKTFEVLQPRGLVLEGVRHQAQTPFVFHDLAEPLGQPIPKSPARLGIRVRDVDGGVQVTQVDEGTPAAWAGFRVGERITQAVVPGDGMWEEYVEIKTVADLQKALAGVKGPQVMALTCALPGEQDERGVPRQRERRVHLSH